MLTGKRLVLGVSGGIAAYKSIELCRRLVDAGMFVSPVLTKNAERFVGAATFAALASEPPRTDMWGAPEPSPHTTLGQSADIVVIAPATARIIASYALGLSDDLLATTLLATRAPVVMCPAMHTEMWENPAVQANIELLRQRGVVIVGPEAGHLAGGDQGVGRLVETDAIVEAIRSVFASQDSLAGKTVLVTAGGTREAIDPVRFIGNRSSGKQGFAVAAEAQSRGARVILITTTEAAIPHGVEAEHVETAQDMHDAVLRHLSSVDVVVMAAAVADFRAAHIEPTKIKKQHGIPHLALEATPDILQAIAEKRHKSQVIVGFAAETQDAETNAFDKLERKQLDLIVANDVSKPNVGFGYETNAVLILDKSGRKYETGVVEKRRVAVTLLDIVERQLGDLVR